MPNLFKRTKPEVKPAKPSFWMTGIRNGEQVLSPVSVRPGDTVNLEHIVNVTTPDGTTMRVPFRWHFQFTSHNPRD